MIRACPLIPRPFSSQSESTAWDGDIVDGGKIYHRRNPAVYVTTKKLVEQDHYTLVPC